MNTADITCIKITEQNMLGKNQPENNINWYDRVYLCYEDTNLRQQTTYDPIKGFNCYRYNSIRNANIGWNNKHELHKLSVKHTMIPICRWVPEIFDRHILNWKLRKIYWGGKICMGYG